MPKLPAIRSADLVTINPPPAPSRAATDADLNLMASWLALKRSEHTQRAYRRVAGRFLAELPMGLAEAQETDVASALAKICVGRSETSANTYCAIVKSLLSRAHKKK